MDGQILEALNKAREARAAVVVLSENESGKSQLINEGDTYPDQFQDAITSALQSGKGRTILVDEKRFFINVYLPATRLVAIGAVHITQYLAKIAAATGFNLEIIDPRTAFATPERFNDARLYADWPKDILAENPLDPYCALIAVTHDPKIDDFALEAALNSGCFYVGALGSRKTHEKRLVRLCQRGVSDTKLAQIKAPIGLDISAANPSEIAVAILAQIIKELRNRGSD